MWHGYLFFYLLLLALLAVISTTLVQSENTIVSNRLADKARLFVDEQMISGEGLLAGVTKDLEYLASFATLEELPAKQRDSLEFRQTVDHMARHFLHFAQIKRIYDQIRVIGHDGQEWLRIELENQVAVRIPAEKLQNKAHRYYFTETMALQPGQIYVSPFDLNIEDRKVEVPLKPMLRFATPLADASGNRLAMVIVNYLGQNLIRNLNHPREEHPGQTVLLNAGGQYITGFRPEQAWGFMFPEHPQQEFHQEYPFIWSQARQQIQGQIETPDQQIVTFARLRIASQSSAQCHNCELVIVNRIGNETRRQALLDNLAPTVPTVITVLVLLLTSGVLMIRNSALRHKANQELVRLYGETEREKELYAGGPTVVFRWRNEIGWPVEYVSPNVASIFGYQPGQFMHGSLGLASIVVPENLPLMTEELARAIDAGQTRFSRTPFRIVDTSGRQRWVRESSHLETDGHGRNIRLYSYLNDISDLKQAEAELERSRSYMQTLVDTIPDPTLVVDVQTLHVVTANQAAEQVYLGGQRGSEGLTCYQLSHKTDQPCHGRDEPCPVRNILENRRTETVVHRHFDAKGMPFFVEIHATPIIDEKGEIIQIVESHRDITQHVETQHALTELATTDPLTGIFNRNKFEQELSLQSRKARKSGGRLGLIMFDLDHFKQVNDTFGHDAGDEVLKETIEVLSAHVRGTDILCRWGGEEFMVLLPRADLAGVETVAETLRHAVEQHVFPHVSQVTISLGATVWSRHDTDEELVRRADQAMYASKQAGRNRATILAREKIGEHAD